MTSPADPSSQTGPQPELAAENARLSGELRTALERQTATSEILDLIAGSPKDVGPVFQAIAERANRLIAGYSTAVFQFVGETAHLAAMTRTSEEADKVLRTAFPRPINVSEEFVEVQRGRTLELEDIEMISTNVRDIARARGFRSALFTPLQGSDCVIGMISVTRAEAGKFAAGDVALLKTFANQAVIAIENARLFAELQLRTDELSKSLDELRAAQDRLVQTEKLASLGQLTAGIAHEIKNPLNFVNNFAALSVDLLDELGEVLSPQPLAGDTAEEVAGLTQMLKDNLGKVVEHGKRADSIVRNMLLHSRSGSGERSAADINALVGEAVHLAYHGARAERPSFNVTLKTDFDPQAGSVPVHAQEITRVLLNLISNGFYAVGKRGENEAQFEPQLSAVTRNLGNAVEIRIRDNGIGIPPAVRERLFTPFFTTKPAGEGTGLGLSISHDIVVKQHGGTLAVESEPGAFTEFRILLPR